MFATEKLLNKYDINTQCINISNGNIEGPLDLRKFEKNKILDCTNNKITHIINLPPTLEYLNCSKNEINKLENLPDHSIEINCKKNQLYKLYYPFDVEHKKYPTKLTHLTWRFKF